MSEVERFRASEAGEWSGATLALWWAGRGNWERAHKVAQETDGADGAWVHAMLHRKEGDLANAGYWYRRAGRRLATVEIEVEWAAMVRELAGRSDGLPQSSA